MNTVNVHYIPEDPYPQFTILKPDGGYPFASIRLDAYTSILSTSPDALEYLAAKLDDAAEALRTGISLDAQAAAGEELAAVGGDDD